MFVLMYRREFLILGTNFFYSYSPVKTTSSLFHRYKPFLIIAEVYDFQINYTNIS